MSSAVFPLRLRGDLTLRYVAVNVHETDGEQQLLCDPLTGLVSYPSFEAFLIEQWGQLLQDALHIAIGDVDDLTGYVLSERMEDATQFGHLAGNYCMRRVGGAVRGWCNESAREWPFVICATFGGDEVIVAASGVEFETFADGIRKLSARIELLAPRPCSFVAATTRGPSAGTQASREGEYRRYLARVDRYLFRWKARSELQVSERVVIAGDLTEDVLKSEVNHGNAESVHARTAVC